MNQPTQQANTPVANAVPPRADAPVTIAAVHGPAQGVVMQSSADKPAPVSKSVAVAKPPAPTAAAAIQMEQEAAAGQARQSADKLLRKKRLGESEGDQNAEPSADSSYDVVAANSTDAATPAEDATAAGGSSATASSGAAWLPIAGGGLGLAAIGGGGGAAAAAVVTAPAVSTFAVSITAVAGPITAALNALATIVFTTAGGTATAGSDYTAANQTLSFAAGETSKTVTVALIDDTLAEGNETVVAAISNASSGTINTATATLNTGTTQASFFVNGAQYIGGLGVDRLGGLARGKAQGSRGGGVVTGGDGRAVERGVDHRSGAAGVARAGHGEVDVAAFGDVVAGNAGVIGGSREGIGLGEHGARIAGGVVHAHLQGVVSRARHGVAAGELQHVLQTQVQGLVARSRHAGDLEALDEVSGAGRRAEVECRRCRQRESITVTTVDDTLTEGNETLSLVLSNPTGGNLAIASAAATIVDNEVAIFTIDGATGTTMTEGGGNQTFTVRRSGLTTGTDTVRVISGGGSASNLTDYFFVDSTLTFAPGDTSKTIQVTPMTDALAEDDVSFDLQLMTASAGARIDPVNDHTTVTIKDDDTAVISFDNAAAGISFSERAGSATFNLTRSGMVSNAVTVVVQSGGGTATPGMDYTAVNQTVSFAAGETSKTVTVAINNDTLAEANETFTLQLANPTGGAIIAAAANTITGTILDNDQPVWSVASNGNANEGGGMLAYTVSRTGDKGAATILFSTTGGTATAGSDYTAIAGQTLSFALGETTKTVMVAVTDDTALETNETVGVLISNASAGAIATATASASILDNDQPVWSIVSNGNANENSLFMDFTVTRTGSASAAATISMRQFNGTTATNGDIGSIDGVTLTFAAGETSKVVAGNLVADSLVEGDESVSVQLTTPSTGTISPTGAVANATLMDAQTASWSVNSNGDAAEDSGFLTYTVTRSGNNISSAATIQFTTMGGTATAGSDYTVVNQTLSFAAGELSKTVAVAIAGDALLEAGETVNVLISNASSGSVGKATASATIMDGDQSSWSVVGNAGADEGATALIYTVSRTNPTGVATIVFTTGGGTATAGTDYTAVSQTLTFAAGETSKTVAVAVSEDAAVEGNETVLAMIGNASSGVVANGVASATSYGISQTSDNVFENTGMAAYTITRSGDITGSTTSYFRTNGGTATGGGVDYIDVASQTLNWTAGEKTKVVFMALVDDTAAESTETLVGQIATDNGFTTGLATASINLLDNDTASAPYAYVVTATGAPHEADGLMAFTVTRSGDLAVASTSYFRTNGGTATGGGVDYTDVSIQTLNWAAGQTTKVVTVALAQDVLAETNETIVGQSATDSGFSTGTSSATGTVIDDDLQTMAAGVADTLVTGTASGSYLGGLILDTGDMNDLMTIGTASNVNSVINLGAGNDTLNTGTTQANFFVAGAQYLGGAGVDTLALDTTTAFNFRGAASPGNFVKGFEIVSMAAAGNQTLNLSLGDVLEFTSGNSVADTLRITGTAGDVLNLGALGKTLTTQSAGTNNLTDVDGTVYSVVASAAGNASANDVAIGGQTYDVYRYQHDGHTINLLINVLLTTSVV
jgi:hypothetical protein